MPVCEFERSGALRVAIVDETELKFMANKAKRTLKSGDYAVHFFAKGNAGDAYTLNVTKPPSAVTAVKGTIDSSGKDAGLFWIQVKS